MLELFLGKSLEMADHSKVTQGADTLHSHCSNSWYRGHTVSRVIIRRCLEFAGSSAATLRKGCCIVIGKVSLGTELFESVELYLGDGLEIVGCSVVTMG